MQNKLDKKVTEDLADYNKRLNKVINYLRSQGALSQTDLSQPSPTQESESWESINRRLIDATPDLVPWDIGSWKNLALVLREAIKASTIAPSERSNQDVSKQMKARVEAIEVFLNNLESYMQLHKNPAAHEHEAFVWQSYKSQLANLSDQDKSGGRLRAEDRFKGPEVVEALNNLEKYGEKLAEEHSESSVQKADILADFLNKVAKSANLDAAKTEIETFKQTPGYKTLREARGWGKEGKDWLEKKGLWKSTTISLIDNLEKTIQDKIDEVKDTGLRGPQG